MYGKNAVGKIFGGEPFRILPGSQATGAEPNKKRLTNLKQLTVDTTWYTRYRATGNPDFGDMFPPLQKNTKRGAFGSVLIHAVGPILRLGTSNQEAITL
jgi:hypothetical protein